MFRWSQDLLAMAHCECEIIDCHSRRPKLALLLVQAHNIAAECRAAATLQMSTADLEALACERPVPPVTAMHVYVI